MDIQYLLFLQNLRESTNDLFSPFLIGMTNIAVGFWPIAMVCMVYWVFDRKAGKRLLGGFEFGILANGLLKLTFRVARPWLRDERILPYGDSKISATGYSFPSGHSTYATALFGGLAWWQRKQNKILMALFLAATFLILFSRNYLGVHTPQDVIVGMITTIIMMYLVNSIENWTDRDPKRDLIVMAVGIVICIGCAFYYQSIEIAELYDSAGTLVIDPAHMKADSFEGIGGISTFVVCRYFERRYFDFDTKSGIRERFIMGILALIPLYYWDNVIYYICGIYSRAFGLFTRQSGIIIYTMIIVPFIMKKISNHKFKF